MSPADLEPLAMIAAEVAAAWGLELEPPFALSRYSYVAPAGEDAASSAMGMSRPWSRQRARRRPQNKTATRPATGRAFRSSCLYDD